MCRVLWSSSARKKQADKARDLRRNTDSDIGVVTARTQVGQCGANRELENTLGGIELVVRDHLQHGEYESSKAVWSKNPVFCDN